MKAGKDFAALAKQHSQDPGSAANGGDLASSSRARWSARSTTRLQPKPGATSDLVESDFGYHIIRVAEKQPGRTVPLDEVRPKIEQYPVRISTRKRETEAFVKRCEPRARSRSASES